jgi:carboxymethylenebutenolidase
MTPEHGEFLEITAGPIEVVVDEKPRSSEMEAYLARPLQPGSYPGIVVGFELFGMTRHIRNIVERLAQLGYIVIAPDFYHRTAPGVALEATAEGRAAGFALLHQLTRQQAIDDVRSVMGILREDMHVPHTGMVGFSVGGHIGYLAATQLDLEATVVFYPGWLSVQDIPMSRPEPTLKLTPGIAAQDGYLLFLVGERDPLIPPEQREAIAQALLAANVRHEIVTYPDAPHGFFCDERDSYHRASADDAWRRIRKLFAVELS